MSYLSRYFQGSGPPDSAVELAKQRFREGLSGKVASGAPESDRPTIVLGTPRSGSNLLVSFLNSLVETERDAILGEVLNEATHFGVSAGYDAARCLEHMRKLTRVAAGFKLFFPQLAHYGIALRQLDEAFPKSRYLVIYRRDLLAQFVSIKVAMSTGQWVLTRPNDRVLQRIRLDSQEFHRYCLEVKAAYGQVTRGDAARERHLFVAYESLAGDPQAAFRDSVCPFLEIGYRPVTTPNLKQSQGLEIEDYLENPGIVEALRREPAVWTLALG